MAPFPLSYPDGHVSLASWRALFLALDHEGNNRTRVHTCFQPTVKVRKGLRPKQVLAQQTHRLSWGAVNVRSLRAHVTNVNGILQVEGADPTKPYEICTLLAQHKISLAALSEVRWKGTGSIQLGNYLCLFSGLPEAAPVALQGVGIVLDPSMTRAWRQAGSQVTYASARLIKIVLTLQKRTIHVISVYAPTYNRTEQEKEDFYSQLGALLQSCKSGEEVIIMGDFNARVGTRPPKDLSGIDTQTDDSLVLGPYGLDELNDNGRLLLEFCRRPKGGHLRIMSTYFQHKQYGTWQHNRTKRWHQIDHVLCTPFTAPLITDVKVLPGLDFDSDHRLVKLSLRIMAPCKQPQGHRVQPAGTGRQRLPRLNVSHLRRPDVAHQLNSKMGELLENDLLTDYSLFSYGLRQAGKYVLGQVRPVHRPKWQLDNQDTLAELAKRKQLAYEQIGASEQGRAQYRIVRKQ